MGLSAQQCRLLTITGRKSDCEFRSMALSHEKIALSREMSDISSEYQNSLDKTKLVYDYYGRGDNSTALSYSLLMSPSALNDYTPVTITDTMGKTVLDRRYAAAARYAGIPQEGVGGLPSDVVRERFLQGLFGNGIITQVQKEQFQSVPYSQLAGVGGSGSLTVYTDTVNKEGLTTALKSNGESRYNKNTFGEGFEIYDGNNKTSNFTLSELLNNEKSYTLVLSGNKEETKDQGPIFNSVGKSRAKDYAEDFANENMEYFYQNIEMLLEMMASELGAVLEIPNDPMTSNAISHAMDQLLSEIYNVENKNLSSDSSGDGFIGFGGATGTSSCESTSIKKIVDGGQAANYLGINAYAYGSCDRGFSEHEYSMGYAAGINLNNLAQAFMTKYAQFMEGELASSDPTYYAEKGNVLGQKDNWVTSDPMYLYNIYVGQKFSAETAKMAAFYDTILNQLCSKGWTEDVKVVDNKHLEETLTNGKVFVSRLKDDGYYYQGNYATDIYIKVVTDDSYIAKAEAKYNSEKNKLNQKEQMLDMKMKNLDTEISALTTEYDTIKSTISKNIEKTFKRYSA